MTTQRMDDLIDAINSQHPDLPLEQLTTAVLNAETMQARADRLVAHFVNNAREHGASWAEIGTCLGVTKQAVQKRFTAKASTNMFTQFSEEARLAIMQSQEEARAERAARISPRHLLLGLLSVADSSAALTLASEGVTLASVRAVPVPDSGLDASPAVIPYDDDAKAALAHSVEIAVSAGRATVGTEHVFAAIQG
ncbi:MAG: Clp protease N-terminal domain-containing protein [bacterium]|nr:Clp protease N-terminal domain-containing protein [bacterium]